MTDMAAQVVVVGSLGTDYTTRTPRFPKPGETVFGHGMSVGFGGKGANQCIVAERLGARTAFVGKLGYDSMGDDYLAELAATTVNIDHLTRTHDAQSAVANIKVDDYGENCIVIVAGANKKMSADDVTAARDVITRAKVLVCQNEITQHATKAALQLARAHGVKTLFNAGPALPDLDPEILKNSDIVCVNETEAETLTGVSVTTVSDAVQAGHQLVRESGCGVALLTLGAKGVVWVQAGSDDYEWVNATSVQAVDTTGAGDAFIGALAYFLSNRPELSLRETLRRSCCVATDSVTKHGTWNSFAKREELPQELFGVEVPIQQ